MNKITWEQLLGLIPDVKTLDMNDIIYTRYISWEKLAKEDDGKLRLLGALENEGGPVHATEYKSSYNYWSPESPIALAYYPYNGCDVYQYKENGGIFFIYREDGGHVPEMRCRLVQRQLIILEKPDSK